MSEMRLTEQQMELAAELTHMQRKFVINMVEGGMSQREAMRQAGSKAKTEAALDNSASDCFSKSKVRAFYDSLIQSAASEAIMTREEALATLTEIARTGTESQPANSEEDGETVIIMRSTDRISAIKQMAAMQGWNAPQKVEGELEVTEIQRRIVDGNGGSGD